MPKMKTHRGACKRFKTTSSGRVKHRSAFTRHILTTKSPKRLRQLRGLHTLAEADERAVHTMLGLR